VDAIAEYEAEKAAGGDDLTIAYMCGYSDGKRATRNGPTK